MTSPDKKKYLLISSLDNEQRGHFMGNKDGQQVKQRNITDVLYVTFQETIWKNNWTL